MSMPPEYDDLLGEQVVLDTTAPLVYIGSLSEVNDAFFVLDEVDVHEIPPGGVSKEVYLMEAKQNGVMANRRRVRVKQADVISISRLDEIISF